MLWCTGEFMVDSVALRSFSCETSLNHHPSTTVLDSFQNLKKCLVFSKHGSVFYSQTSPLWYNLSKDIVADVLIQLCKPPAVFCLARRDFLVATCQTRQTCSVLFFFFPIMDFII
ncbi:hypothetical protein AMECASPLE_009351 [Ameca splendens]|uniref:Uncharacterized protein n=1 Tax=Ameca splendens TaxID=208324 RepID=A0ABV0Z908_9TELE